MKKKFYDIKEELSKAYIEYKIFIMIAFIGFLICIGTGIINFVIGLGKISVLISFTMAMVIVVLIYISSKKKNIILISYIILTLLCVVFYPSMWINSAGSHGTIPLFYVMNAVVIAILFNKRNKYIMIVVQLISVGLLLIFEYQYPEYIIPYSNNLARNIDFTIMMSVICIIVFSIITIVMKEYNNKIDDLDKMQKKFRKLSITDSLSGLYNRRYIMEKLDERIYKENYDPITLIMLDLDYFKVINDNYGHSTGNEVINTVSQSIRQTVPECSTVARIGGEEFLVALYNTDITLAIEIAENIRINVKNLELGLEMAAHAML